MRDNTQIQIRTSRHSEIRCAHIAKLDLFRTFHFDEALFCACFLSLCKVYIRMRYRKYNVNTLLTVHFSSGDSHNIRDSLREPLLSIQYSFIKDTSPKLHVTFFPHLYIHSVVNYKGIIRISELN